MSKPKKPKLAPGPIIHEGKLLAIALALGLLAVLAMAIGSMLT